MAKTFSFGGIQSGQIFQLGIVVPDIDEAVKFYAEALGIGPFSVSRGFKAPDGSYRGSTEMPELTLAHTWGGRFFVELIQQHCDTPSVYKEFIDRHGYGLHHFGFAVDPAEFDKTQAHYYSLGFEDIFTDNLPGGTRVRYMGPKGEAALDKLRNETGVSYYECVEMFPAEESFFTDIYNAAMNWDGKTLFHKGSGEGSFLA